MNRRDLLEGLFPVTIGAAFGAPRLASAAARASEPELTSTPLTDSILLISGGGGNVVVFKSPEGVLMVDGGSPERSRDVLRLVRKSTGTSKVHTLFNTHWHWEQTGSNRTLGRAGTRIIAHENTRLWLTTEIESKWQDKVFPPLPREAHPNETFYSDGKLTFGGEQIEYGHLPQAHTDGDIYVFFRQANVLVTGDVVSVGAYPICDYTTNGWIGGMVNATRTLIDLSNDDTRVVPGLGPVQSRADLQAEHDMLATLKLRLSKLLAQGMSAQDMIDAQPTREFDARWGDPRLFIANVWQGLVPRARELGVSIV